MHHIQGHSHIQLAVPALDSMLVHITDYVVVGDAMRTQALPRMVFLAQG